MRAVVPALLRAADQSVSGFLPDSVLGFLPAALWLSSFPSASSQHLIRLGRHEAVQVGVAWKAVFKRNDISRAADETAPRRHIGNVTELRFRNVQKAGKLLPVCGGLVEQN